MGMVCASTVWLTGDAAEFRDWYPRPSILHGHLRKAPGYEETRREQGLTLGRGEGICNSRTTRNCSLLSRNSKCAPLKKKQPVLAEREAC